jgi:hypothetical protein
VGSVDVSAAVKYIHSYMGERVAVQEYVGKAKLGGSGVLVEVSRDRPSAVHDFDAAAEAYDLAHRMHLPWVRVEREDGTHVCNVVMPATDQETKENIT